MVRDAARRFENDIGWIKVVGVCELSKSEGNDLADWMCAVECKQ